MRFKWTARTKPCFWHHWFAWKPVNVGGDEYRWLEIVWRRGDKMVYPSGVTWRWYYKPIEARHLGAQ